MFQLHTVGAAVDKFVTAPKVLVTAGMTIAALGGFVVGVRYAQMEFNKVIDARVEEEVLETKRVYKARSETSLTQPYATPEEAIAALEPEEAELITRYNTISKEAKLEKEIVEEAVGELFEKINEELSAIDPVIETNLFVKTYFQDFDMEAAMAERNPDAPYIITYEEYERGEAGYIQADLTYFQEDEVLVDDKSVPVENKDDVAGEINLEKFGYGADRRDVVYVRNDRLEMDFEIAESDGSYAQEVLGYFEHSDKPRARRFRNGDDE